MATTYKAQVEFHCWKQHRCVQCDGTYRYELKRKVTGEGSSEAEAAKAAAALVESAVQNDVDPVPCPECGTVQPDMVASGQRPFYGWSLLVGLVGVAVALVLGFTHVVTIARASTIAALSTGVAGLGVLVGSLRNPNGNRDANRRRAENLIERGRLKRFTTGSDDASDGIEVRAFTPSNLVALAMYGFAVLAAFVAVGMQQMNGWPTNPDWYPAVVGPGDTSVYYAKSKLRSIKGYWRGGASLTTAEPLPGGARFTASTKSSSWGDTISGKSVSSSTNRLWARIGVPDDPDLAGKTIPFDLDISVNYPFEAAGGFMNGNDSFHEKGQVQLAGVGAGGTYWTSWWVGATAACALMIMATIGLYGAAGRLVAAAHPTEVFDDEDTSPTPEQERQFNQKRDEFPDSRGAL